MNSSRTAARLLPFMALAVWTSQDVRADGPPRTGAIPIAEVARATPVDFATEILPILRSSCLACHNATEAEADLVLESPRSILNGGAGGPAVVPGAGGASRLLRAAAHQIKPSMPPRDNKAGAKPLTPEQLGLVRLWIDQGAKGSAEPRTAPVAWQATPAHFQPIYAVALTPDGKYAACGRADQVFIYDLPAARLVARLSDPDLADGRAHVDSVRSLAFSPTGDVLASGGFRTIKLWRRPRTVRAAAFALDDSATAVAVNPAGTRAAFASAGGRIVVRALPTGTLVRELVARKDGVPPVSGLCFAPDGARLYAGTPDGSVRGWNVADGSNAGALATPSPVQALAFLDQGGTLVTGHDDGRLRIWDASALAAEFVGPPRPRVELKAHDRPITGLATWPTAPGEVLTASADGVLRRWDVVGAKLVREYANDGPVVAVAARPDGARFASVGARGVRLWDALTGALVAERKADMRALDAIRRAEGAIDCATVEVAFRQQERREADARVEGLTKALEEAKKLVAPAEKTLAEKREAAKKPLADREAAEAALTAALATEVRTHLARKEAEAALAKARDAVGPARDQAEAAVKAANEAAQVAERKRGEAGSAVYPAREKGMAAENQVKDAETARESALFSVKTASLVLDRDRPLAPRAQAAVGAAEALLLQRKTEKTATEEVAKAAERPWCSVAFSSDGAWLFAGDDSATHVFDAAQGLAQAVLEERTGAIRALAAGSTGEVIAFSETRATVYRVAGPWALARIIGGVDDPDTIADRVLGLDFHPNGDRLASAGGEPGRAGELKVWEVATGKLIREFPTLHTDAIFGVRFSPTGAVLATASADRLVKIVGLADGAPVVTLSGHANHARGVAWRADGTVLASCGADNMIKVWDAAAGSLLRTETGDPNPLSGYRREVTSIAFIGGSDLMLASSGDKTVRVHRAGSPQLVKTCQGASAFLYCAAATRDGKTILAGGHDGVLRTWVGGNPNPVHEFPPTPARRSTEGPVHDTGAAP